MDNEECSNMNISLPYQGAFWEREKVKFFSFINLATIDYHIL